MTTPDEVNKIIETEVNKIIETSGNSFHCCVVNRLRKNEWSTLVSPYYMDASSNKPREIDLIAEKTWEYKDQWGDEDCAVNLKLFIECKYIPQTNVFWFSQKDETAAKKLVRSISSSFQNENSLINKHHYLKSNQMVAKLFASNKHANTEHEVIYKALNQSLNAMVYLRNRPSIIQKKPNTSNGKMITVETPVILCNNFDKFHKVDMDNTNDPEKIDDNFQLEVNYAYINQNGSPQSEYFLIDVVDFKLFNDFLKQMESDAQLILRAT